MKTKAIRIFLAIGAVMMSVSPSIACSVCSVTNEKARYAYYGTTALLSLLPLLMIGGVVYFIAKKGR